MRRRIITLQKRIAVESAVLLKNEKGMPAITEDSENRPVRRDGGDGALSGRGFFAHQSDKASQSACSHGSGRRDSYILSLL